MYIRCFATRLWKVLDWSYQIPFPRSVQGSTSGGLVYANCHGQLYCKTNPSFTVWVSLSSKHNYVMYAVHNYVCLQISSFGMGIYQQLYTPPMTALVFSTFWAGIGYNFCLKFYHTLLKIRGGELMCVHPVSHARRMWIGRTSAGPILILWGGE